MVHVNAFVAFAIFMSFAATAWSQETAVTSQLLTLTLTENPGNVEVRLGDDLFARYDFRSYDKPIMYPVLGPSQVAMTRNFPMEKVVGEATDHPHHKSIWFAHGDVNGIDFWSEKGLVKQQAITDFDPQHHRFKTKDHWRKRSDDKSGVGEKVAECECTYEFGFDGDARWIEFEYKIIASEGNLMFGDTKEGMFGLRTHPQLRLKADPKLGVPSVSGHAINSNDDTDTNLWGKSAKWVSYWGNVGNETVGFAILDHPSNLRHPTPWHARDYGLVAANPFGLHDFQKLEDGAGNFTLAKGESLTQRYCIVFYTGKHDQAKIEKQFERFAR